MLREVCNGKARYFDLPRYVSARWIQVVVVCFDPQQVFVRGSSWKQRIWIHRGFIENPGSGMAQFPCGRCAGCRVNHAVTWANRMCWEVREHDNTCFVTLTYSDENYPADASVSKKELQLFFKRLRKAVGPDRKLRYFACGEYGERFGRAHYHAVVFGVGFHETGLLESAWNLGFVQAKPFLRERALYCASYLLKEVDVAFDVVGRSKPFALMSKRIGFAFALRNRRRILAGDPITIDGKVVGVPRYFRKVLGDAAGLPVRHGAREAYVDSLLAHLPRVGRDLDGRGVEYRTLTMRAVKASFRASLGVAKSEYEALLALRRNEDGF